MRKTVLIVSLFFVTLAGASAESRLPFSTVFKGRDKFDRLVNSAREGNWNTLPIGERTATVGRARVGTRYKNYTLEIDNRIEAPSVNFNALDCWTFFEIALGFARMLDEPQENWTPERLLHYIELDRYRGGQCTGAYLSRLHYLEDWLADNDRRGLVQDLTRSLGGVSVPHSAREMTVGWRHYRYLANDRSLLGPLRQMEARVSSRPLYMVPKGRVAAIEGKLRRCHRDCFPGWASHVFDFARRAGPAGRGRLPAFHARLGAPQLWTRGDRFEAFELSLPIRQPRRHPRRASGALARLGVRLDRVSPYQSSARQSLKARPRRRLRYGALPKR
jgi:hypothetical protein